MKAKLILFGALASLFSAINSMGQSISGSSTAYVGETITYTYDSEDALSNPKWTTPSGVTKALRYTESPAYRVSIQWTSVGEFTIYLTASGGVSLSKTIIVSNPTPPCSVGTPTTSNYTSCGAGTVTLSAIPGVNGTTVKWYSAASGGILLNTGLTYITTLSATTTFYLSSFNTATNCESAVVPVVVTVVPIGISASDKSRCGPGTLTLTALLLQGYQRRWYDIAVGGEPLNEVDGSFVTPYLTSTKTYYVSAYDPATGCESSRVPVNAIINSIAFSATINGNVRFGSGTLTLTASGAPSGGIYKWYSTLTATTPLYTGDSYVTPNVSSSVDNYVFVEIENAGCSSARVPVNINIIPIPVITATKGFGGDINLTVSSLYASYLWKNNQGVVVGTNQVFGTSLTGSYTVTVTQQGLSYTSSPFILPAQADMGTIDGPSAAIVGQTMAYTFDNGYDHAQPRWAAVNGSVSFFYTPSQATPYTASVTWNFVGDGLIVFYGVEEGQVVVIASKTVRVYPQIGDPVSSNVIHCDIGTVTLTATPGVNSNSIHWYDSQGNLLQTGLSFSPTVTQSTNFYISSFNTELNREGSTRVLVTVTVVPIGLIARDKTHCGPGAVTLTALLFEGKERRWYNVSVGGEYLNEVDGEFTTPYLSSTATYYVSGYDPVTGCETDRRPVKAIIMTPPSPPSVTGNMQFSGVSMSLRASAIDGGIFKWYSDALTSTVLFTGNPYVASAPVSSDNFVYVSTTYQGCEGSRVPVPVTIFPLPVISGTPYVTKNTNTTLTASAGYDSYSWNGPTTSNSRKLETKLVGSYTLTVTKNGISYTTNPPIKVKTQFEDLNMNYIVTSAPVIKVSIGTSENGYSTMPVEQVNQSVEYFDGLGRPIQTVVTQGSPLRQDVIQPLVYDSYGRESKKYLPFTSEQSGRYKTIAYNAATGNYSGVPADFYGANAVAAKIAQDAKPFSEMIFEPSPLNRLERVYGPGAAWGSQQGGDDKYTFQQTLTNNAVDEKIIAWKVSSGLPIRSAPLSGVIETGGYYSTGQLVITSTKDEQGNETREYQNKLGKTVLKKVQVVSPAANLNSAEQWAFTYYVYDDFQNLRFVLQPLLGVLLLANDTYNPTQTELNKFAFQYKYDDRQRLIEKRIPGAAPVYMIYDDRNRLVMSQDGNQRNDSDGNITKKDWTYTKYDAFNRPVISGIYTHSVVLDQNGMQSVVDSYYSSLTSSQAWFESYVETGNGNILGYDNKSFPQLVDANKCLIVNYYDRYNTTIAPTGYEYLIEAPELSGQEATNNTNVLGQVTVTLVKNLTSANWLRTVNYYDTKYRVIQSISDYPRGKMVTTSVYDFVGKVLTSKRTLNEGSVSNTVKETFEYDHAGRLNMIKHSVNGAADVVTVKNSYNELGQLVSKRLHCTDVNATDSKQTVDYRYNIRGWLNSVNDVASPEPTDLFSMNLNYNTPTTNGGVAQYNGNISEILWRGPDAKTNSYGYSYDPMNRLTEAKYYNAADVTKNGRFNEKIWDQINNQSGYDLNGNIKFLIRAGKTGVDAIGRTTYGQMDNIAYAYQGNQLLRVTETGTGVKTEGFIDGTNTGDDYNFDANGNMIHDLNKGIGAGLSDNINKIFYNHLNLPARVQKSANSYVQYVYDATGRKLQQVAVDNGGAAKTTDYAGEFIYENNVLQFINHEEGRITMTGSQPEYQYHLKDHLGNVRVTFTTKDETTTDLATLEAASQASESDKFLRYDRVRLVNHILFDHTNNANAASGNAIRLSGNANEKTGLIKSLSVMPGDVIDMEVYAKYIDTDASHWTAALTTLLSGIAAGTAPAGTVTDGASYSTNSTNPFPYTGLNNTASSTGAGPKAYLNYLVFDRDFNLIPSKSGYKRLSGDPKEAGNNVAHEKLSSQITIAEAGFVYIYLSNEEASPVEVFFDDFKVTLVKSPVVSAQDYYPFGLQFNSYSRENSVAQDYKYNGMEEQSELGLNWLDYGARMYDPAIARWMAIDPLTELSRRWSPYSYCYNNPIIFVDPDGMFGEYYAKDGTYIGSDGIDDDKAYVVNNYDKSQTQTHDDGTTSTVVMEADVQEVKDKDGNAVSNSTLMTLAAASYGESSPADNTAEMYGISSAIVNNNDARAANGKDESLSDTAYKIADALTDKNNERRINFQEASASDRNGNGGMKTSIAGAINAVTGGVDLSNGATGWDGADLRTNDHRFGLNISNSSHDIYSVGDRPLSKPIQGASYKRQTTATHGGTVFIRIHPDWVKTGSPAY